MTTGDVLVLDCVHTHIGEYHILQGVSFRVPRHGVTVLLGRNGAGKSTTLRTVMGLWRASAGKIRLEGDDITAERTFAISRRGIAYVPEDMGIFASLTVQENLRLAAVGGPPDKERMDWILGLFPALWRFWLRPAGSLSGGQKQMLAIARAIVVPRRLLLIDEPTKGLAPGMVQSLALAMRALKQTDTTVLLVEQNFHFASTLGDHVAVMDDGRIVHECAMAELAKDAAMQERLLGLQLTEDEDVERAR